MGNKLRFYEKVRLSWRAFFDLKRGRIRIDRQSTTVRRKRRGDQLKDATEIPQTAVSHYVCLNSPLIMRELTEYENFREYYLSKRKHFYWMRVFTVLPIPRISAFSHMLNNLDYQINELESRLNMLAVEYGGMIAELNRSKDDFERNGESHMVQLCVNRANNLRREYFQKSVHVYRALIAQLTVKAGQLKKVEDYLTYIRTHQFHKIRVYHEKVCLYSPYAETQIDPEYLTDEQLSMLCNAETAGRYEDEWKQTKEMLEKYSKELERITPVGKKK